MEDADLANALETEGSPEALAMATELRRGKLTRVLLDRTERFEGWLLLQTWTRYLPGEPTTANVPAHLAQQVPHLVQKLRAVEDAEIELLVFGTSANDPGYMLFREIEGGRVVSCLRLRR